MTHHLPHTMVLAASQMQSLEEQSYHNGLSPAALMEQAIQLMCAHICAHYPQTTHRNVVVLCGGGGNGADGFGIARSLKLRGYKSYAARCGQKERAVALNEEQETYAVACGVGVLPEQTRIEQLQDLCSQADLIVDALTGFGFQGDLRGQTAEWIRNLREIIAPIVAVDLPSGLTANGTTDPNSAEALPCKETLCLGHLKPVLCDDRFLRFVGQVTVLPLDTLPPSDEQVAAATLSTSQVLRELHDCLSKLPRAAHKFNRGLVGVRGGSIAFPGAGILASSGALAAGVGYVTVFSDSEHCLQGTLARHPSVVVQGSSQLLEFVQEPPAPNKPRALLVGSGLPELEAGDLKALAEWRGPVVADAGALSAAAVRRYLPYPSAAALVAPRIVTPHQGEFDQLWQHCLEFHGVSSGESSRIDKAKSVSAVLNVTLVLKGATTIICRPEGGTWVHHSPNPELARAGTGDVLAGYLAGLLARGVPEHTAVGAAVALHSAAAEPSAQSAPANALSNAASCFPSRLAQTLEATTISLSSD